MKKIVSIVFCLFLLISSVSNAFNVNAESSDEKSEYFSDEQKNYYSSLGLQGTTLNVYNWGEYISDGEDESMYVVKEFEALTGCDVNYTNFESNENMYSKISGGGVSYDVIIPSDYMIQRLISENLLEELDYSNIPNYDKYIDEKYHGLYYDPDEKYTVPYNVGTTVLIYNKKYFDEAPTSWKVLWDEKYAERVLMFNNPRDAFAIAMSIKGYSFNTTNEEEWKACSELLKEQRTKVKPEYVMDEVFNKMCSGDYALATYYAGDYVTMLDDNEDLGYCFPEEGVNYFYDAMCIPKGCQNKKGAEAFINFMQEPETALANAEYIYYASPNKAVVSNPDYSLNGNEAVYPTTEPKSQYFENLPQNTLQLMNDLWVNVKDGGNKENYMPFIICGIVLAVVIIIVIMKLVKNKNKSSMQDI